MKLTTPTIGVLATIIILASVGAFYAGPAITDLSLTESSGPTGAAFMVGNVKVTHFDKDGQVLGYRQGTNHITANGMMVIMGQVFHGVNASFPAQDNVSGTVRWMEVGTGGDTEFPFLIPRDYDNALRWNDTDIVEQIKGPSPTFGLLCSRVSAVITNGSQGPANTAPEKCNSEYPLTYDGVSGAHLCNARINVTATADFDGNNCEKDGIDEAGIFTTQESLGAPNAGGTMFARNTFGSVDLGDQDTLRLEWEFTFTDS